MGSNSYTLKEQDGRCNLESNSNGKTELADGMIVHDSQGNLVIVGLCRWSGCSKKRKNEKGHHGKLLIFSKKIAKNGHCQWKVIKGVDIPESANFREFTSISMDIQGHVVISSQKESMVWVGQLLGRTSSDLWDLGRMKFNERKGNLFYFPKNDDCRTIFCNIRGVQWLNSEMLITVSSRMKRNQHFECFQTSEHVHVFVLP